MCLIENYRAILRMSGKINECIDLATKIQSAPTTERSSEDLAEVLGITQNISNHLVKQLEKVIEFEKELIEIEKLALSLTEIEDHPMKKTSHSWN
jgi:hypothetical protein